MEWSYRKFFVDEPSNDELTRVPHSTVYSTVQYCTQTKFNKGGEVIHTNWKTGTELWRSLIKRSTHAARPRASME